jgi:ketosteroid isomerase-like protein
MAASELEHVIEQQHLALDQFVKGNAEPLAKLCSRQDDVTLGNPFGPFARGFDQVAETMRRAAANYKGGEATGFDQLSKHVTADLAYIVETERYNAKIGEAEEAAAFSLRCTSIFRWESGSWRLVHRHADPITTPQPAESVIRE